MAPSPSSQHQMEEEKLVGFLISVILSLAKATGNLQPDLMMAREGRQVKLYTLLHLVDIPCKRKKTCPRISTNLAVVCFEMNDPIKFSKCCIQPRQKYRSHLMANILSTIQYKQKVLPTTIINTVWANGHCIAM